MLLNSRLIGTFSWPSYVLPPLPFPWHLLPFSASVWIEWQITVGILISPMLFPSRAVPGAPKSHIPNNDLKRSAATIDAVAAAVADVAVMAALLAASLVSFSYLARSVM